MAKDEDNSNEAQELVDESDAEESRKEIIKENEGFVEAYKGLGTDKGTKNEREAISNKFDENVDTYKDLGAGEKKTVIKRYDCG